MNKIVVTAFAVAYFTISGLFTLFALNSKTAAGVKISAVVASTFLWGFWVLFLVLLFVGLVGYLHQTRE